MKPPSCYYCDEAYGQITEDEWVPECECEAREAKREAAEEAFWDRKIDEARGK